MAFGFLFGCGFRGRVGCPPIICGAIPGSSTLDAKVFLGKIVNP